MGTLLRQAEDILDVAAAGDSSAATAIILGRDGTLRMLDGGGWSLPALKADTGASVVFKVERRGSTVRVEGWDGAERCLLERRIGCRGLQDLGMTLLRPTVNWLQLSPAVL